MPIVVIIFISNINILLLSILDSSEMHSEENKVSLEKNVKRRFKTRAQVVALENFYNGIKVLHIISHFDALYETD